MPEKLNRLSVGDLAKLLILAGDTVLEVVRKVRMLKPECSITAECVYFYRSQLRKQGFLA